MTPRPIAIKFKRLRKAFGYADDKTWTIELAKNQNDIQLMGTALHEVAHLVFPDLDEAAILRFERHAVDVLLRLGFRRTEGDGE